MILMDGKKLHMLYNTNYSNDATPLLVEPLLETICKLKEQQKNPKPLTPEQISRTVTIEIREERK